MTLAQAVTLVVFLALLPLLVAWSLWLLFALLALLPPRRLTAAKTPAAPVAIDILIPAHNEELLLPRLLETLRLQTAAGAHRLGTILVIADHCADRTASIARSAHVEVLERASGPRGKPAALRDGLALLDNLAQIKNPKSKIQNPPARAVMIIDADCTLSPNLLEQTARAFDAGAQVTQAAYILDESHRPASGKKLSTAAVIAFALKNWIRPRGMDRLGLPTQLFGTGMCFRADLLARISFNDHLTEDLKISHDLLIAGVAPRFLPAALVRSPLPDDRHAMSTQKLRWETGQLQTWSKLPVMLFRLLSRGYLRSAVALLDWSAPPLAMAVFYWLGVSFASVLLAVGRVAPVEVMLAPMAALVVLFLYVLIGGAQVSGIAAVGRLFLSLPRFIFWKLALYAQMLAGRGPRAWQRTPRGEPPHAPDAVGQEAIHPQ